MAEEEDETDGEEHVGVACGLGLERVRLRVDEAVLQVAPPSDHRPHVEVKVYQDGERDHAYIAKQNNF